MNANAERIIVGLSGGVDSAVAALRLLEAGYRVEGLFMKNWEDDDEPGYCAAAEDLEDAKAICRMLEITLHKVNFASEYWDRVFAHFLQEYRAGRTPNPDILCNREIKFRAFLDYARKLGAAGIATGHYARVAEDHGRFQLLRGRDRNKDQSYFLYTLGQEQLCVSHFPLGDLAKPEVRAIAAAAGFPNHAKKDSTGICFIGERRFADFLKRYLPAQPGEIISIDGDILGEHQGLMLYTPGQRQGLGIGGVAGQDEAPWYVVDKDLAKNRLIVAQGHDHPALLGSALIAQDMHWVSGAPPAEDLADGQAYEAMIRYRQKPQACRLRALENRPQQYRIEFTAPQRAIAPGQSVVLYQGEICLGGGVIQERS
ncbi:tRNA (5-methylaminomethyl-2-thiouridylate)-methyltransferase [Ectothiorhodosinus mongolicus]|uniref:tRNA-specific 2-thiouridylase MnmA n=1 Tax=Ectothiorhodosinus mongolicus TaxID=233100 RepID=A0A1R3VMG7_9GAMM|nr:tRNA 2-thiouridine(34) synthase MnmA [Ectothiorhodosinus mongolicus]ULX56264.1 tRNA 2-thiouridine(34) synthase MnmA [Ectothiorhodosinus mongolicus]SIT65769.1 tRNA (5-methylaminomethyl-2-thiouridylate)-methyltransferase [Ectothiorhodosinus mongolicus]